MKKIVCVLLLVLLSGCGVVDSVTPADEVVDDFDYTVIIDYDNLPVPYMFELKAGAPDDEAAVYEAAYDLFYRSKNDEAITAFSDFISDFPDSVLASSASNMIGTCYRNKKDFNTAIIKYKETLGIYPGTEAAQAATYNIAYIYFYELNNNDIAKYYYHQLINNVSLFNWRMYSSSLSALSKIDGVSAPVLLHPAFYITGGLFVRADCKPSEHDIFIADLLFDYYISDPNTPEEDLFNKLNINNSYDDVGLYCGWVWMGGYSK